jgi:hypothetical protein
VTALREIERRLPELNRAEKAQVLKWLIGDLEPVAGFMGLELRESPSSKVVIPVAGVASAVVTLHLLWLGSSLPLLLQKTVG